MAIEVRLPELGDAITRAKLTVWLKQEGDRIQAGETIAEVETDKTNVEIEAPGTGRLLRIDVPAGTDDVAIDTVLALIADGEGAGTPELPASATPAAAVAPGGAGHAHAAATSSAAEAPVNPDALSNPDASPASQDVSPLAQRMADAAGVSLDGVIGTGPGGRITKRDVDALLRPGPVGRETRTPTALDDPPPGEAQNYHEPPLSAMRRTTGERMTRAKQTIPHFYLQTDCRVDAVSSMRRELNARREVKVSFTAFAIRAASLALRKVPGANSAWVDGTVRIYSRADIAVAVETPGGLVAPIIRGADGKSLSTLNEELRTLADRARANKLKPEDYTGGTFTLSNLGMFGVTEIFPIVNPPQTCILGIGAVEARAVVCDDAVAVGQVMTCTLSADHRAMDGAAGARLLAAFRQLIEDPWNLIL